MDEGMVSEGKVPERGWQHSRSGEAGERFAHCPAATYGSNTSLNEQLGPVFGELHRFAVTTYRQARRLVVLLVGSTVLAIGVVMILLPGPAILVIPLGLAILAVEFAWARRWLVRVREKAQSLRSR